MALDAGVLHNLTKGSAADAWRVHIPVFPDVPR
mgnify:CR=1 FL=1